MLELYRPGKNPYVTDVSYEPVDIWSVEITPRSVWGALPPKADIEAMPLPVVHVGGWGTEENDAGKPGCCFTREECLTRVLELQKQHMDEGLPDIKYNFIIGDDDNIYEGRGWDKRPAIYWDDTGKFRGRNKDMLEIGYIGINDSKFLHWKMYESFLKLVGQGVHKKFISENYRMWDLFTVVDTDREELSSDSSDSDS